MLASILSSLIDDVRRGQDNWFSETAIALVIGPGVWTYGCVPLGFVAYRPCET